MSRKLGQIIAVRENTWMIRIPMGCDPQTKQRRLKTVKSRICSKTFESYESLLAKYIRPSLGKKPIVAIRPLDVQAVYQHMSDRGLSPRTVQGAHWVLNAAFRQALQWEMILEVPTKGAKLPRIFLKVALPTMYGTLFSVAITTGMRPSEYIGLKWQDVDWERGTVSVKRTLRKGPTGQWEYGETKRAGSRRIIRLQNWVLARLKQLREFQAADPVVDPEEWPEAVDLIFVTEFGRPVNVNSLVYKHFKPILKRAGLPNIRLYDLRHTAATLALTVGVSPKVVSEQLGHTSAAFTLDVYSHVLPHMQDDAAAKVEAALTGSF